MQKYNGYPIYGVAVPAHQNGWYARGLVFPVDLQQTVEIKRLDGPSDLTFKTKKQAEEHALKLCKIWIDEQTSPAT
jgi:hypothetical protein